MGEKEDLAGGRGGAATSMVTTLLLQCRRLRPGAAQGLTTCHVHVTRRLDARYVPAAKP